MGGVAKSPEGEVRGGEAGQLLSLVFAWGHAHPHTATIPSANSHKHLPLQAESRVLGFQKTKRRCLCLLQTSGRKEIGRTPTGVELRSAPVPEGH